MQSNLQDSRTHGAWKMHSDRRVFHDKGRHHYPSVRPPANLFVQQMHFSNRFSNMNCERQFYRNQHGASHHRNFTVVLNGSMRGRSDRRNVPDNRGNMPKGNRPNDGRSAQNRTSRDQRNRSSHDANPRDSRANKQDAKRNRHLLN